MPNSCVLARTFAISSTAALVLATTLWTTSFIQAQPSAPTQQEALAPGEAFVTQFSGTSTAAGGAVINVDGIVGSIRDVRSLGAAPQGENLVGVPQRSPVTATEVGQVFGVAIDDASPPNIYISATSAFGLHLGQDGKWMPGMWGQNGGSGTIYKLDAANGYAPTVFTDVSLNGVPNSGPALGNLAYDRYNKQFFVSDLETGMIHRIGIADGSDLGSFDHGVDGRAAFRDVETGKPGRLPPIPFDQNSQARLTDCPSQFDRSPECWNFSPSGRRVWGLGVYRNPGSKDVRLYYSVWSGPAFKSTTWNAQSEDDKRNSVWSVRIGPDGSFAGDIRREFIVPDFFVNPADIARAGYSQPVSDITFAACGQRPIMLVAERGGIRNLGLDAKSPFATPHEARALRYELDQSGAWRAVGRYEVGFYQRPTNQPPSMHANCSGGIAFGFGYEQSNGTADPNKPDQFVWITGDSLCSPEGPCNLSAAATAPAGDQAQQAAGSSPQDDSEVHGFQGVSEDRFENLTTTWAQSTPNGQSGSAGPNEAYLIDADVNVNEQDQPIEQQFVRDDSTEVGDIAIYQLCAPPASTTPAFLLAPVPQNGDTGHHYRRGSHNATWSHSRYRSHNPYWSHNTQASHSRVRSHNRNGSHNRAASHQRTGSHDRARSHWRTGSHDRRASHIRSGSHSRQSSHNREGSHNRLRSHNRNGSHNRILSHERIGSQHNRVRSHERAGSQHNRVRSHERAGSLHNRARSHHRSGSQHNRVLSHQRSGSQGGMDGGMGGHTRFLSHRRSGSQGGMGGGQDGGMGGPGGMGGHNPVQSHQRSGSHGGMGGMGGGMGGQDGGMGGPGGMGGHNPVQSHQRSGSHGGMGGMGGQDGGMGGPGGGMGGHNPVQSHQRSGSQGGMGGGMGGQDGGMGGPGGGMGGHNPVQSHQRSGSQGGMGGMGGAQQGGMGAHERALSHKRAGSGRK